MISCASIRLDHSFAAVPQGTHYLRLDTHVMTSMNAYPMEDWVHVHKTVPTPLDHSSAAAIMDILCLDMPAVTSMNAYPMVEEVCVHRYAPTPLDHSNAVVSLDTMFQDMIAMILMNACQMEDQVPVNKYAPTPLDHFHAAVCKDFLNMDIPAMKLMNVPWGSVDVLRSAQIQLEASLVPVTMATSWMLTIRLALQSTHVVQIPGAVTKYASILMAHSIATAS